MKKVIGISSDHLWLMMPLLGTTPEQDGLKPKSMTDYIGNKIYEDGVLKMILTDNGYIENGIYYFYITDHLGNNRIVANASGTSIQSTQYYPFGMAFAEGSITEQGKQDYKYNGKELDRTHGLNWYDYSARQLDNAIGRFTTVDPLAEKYYSWSPYVYVANNPINAVDLRGDSITVTNKNGDYLFMLDDGNDKMTTYTAQQLYSKGIQWFASDADNYILLIGIADNLSESASFKHFTSDEILAFSEKDRWMIDYRSGGSGDWKKSKQGADGYLMVTVDGQPYWADAVGQIPFTINKFRDELLKTGDGKLAGDRTIDAGRKYGDGNPFLPTADYSNGYDNAMIQKTVNWASKSYYRGSVYGRASLGKEKVYSPRSLFKY